MGRPKLEINEDLIYKMAMIHCTQKEMAEICECSVETLRNRFTDVITQGRAAGKDRLRSLQWKSAEEGNVEMLKWLGREYLGQGKSHSDELDTTALDALVQVISGHKKQTQEEDQKNEDLSGVESLNLGSSSIQEISSEQSAE